jgi:hypothetical protein
MSDRKPSSTLLEDVGNDMSNTLRYGEAQRPPVELTEEDVSTKFPFHLI